MNQKDKRSAELLSEYIGLLDDEGPTSQRLRTLEENADPELRGLMTSVRELRSTWGYRAWKVGSATGLALVIASCALPDISQINIDACVDGCNNDSQVCLTQVNKDLKTCQTEAEAAPQEWRQYYADQCVQTLGTEAQACIGTCLKCVTSCFAKAESQLGKK
jgi:hypothetical protein